MREKVSIVDDNDKEIAVKFRNELLSTDMHRIVAVWITNSSGQILLAQRAFHKTLHPGLWGPAAAGAVSYGETYDEAAQKEAAEEIGITDLPLKFVEKVIYKADGEKRFIGWYTAVCDKHAEEFELEKDVAQVKWISKTDLKNDLANNTSIYVPSSTMWTKLFLR